MMTLDQAQSSSCNRAVAAFKVSVRIYLAFAGGATANIIPYLLKFVDFTDDLLKGQPNYHELQAVAYQICHDLISILSHRFGMLKADADPKTRGELDALISDLIIVLKSTATMADKGAARRMLLMATLSACSKFKVAVPKVEFEYPSELLVEGSTL